MFEPPWTDDSIFVFYSLKCAAMKVLWPSRLRNIALKQYPTNGICDGSVTQIHTIGCIPR